MPNATATLSEALMPFIGMLTIPAETFLRASALSPSSSEPSRTMPCLGKEKEVIGVPPVSSAKTGKSAGRDSSEQYSHGRIAQCSNSNSYHLCGIQTKNKINHQKDKTIRRMKGNH